MVDSDFEREARDMAEEMFYIVSTAHQSGDSVLFWAPNSCGYRTDVNQAGLYTREAAENIHSPRNGVFMVPSAEIERRAVTYRRVDKYEHLAQLERQFAKAGAR